jgi:hypothetical protein
MERLNVEGSDGSVSGSWAGHAFLAGDEGVSERDAADRR